MPIIERSIEITIDLFIFLEIFFYPKSRKKVEELKIERKNKLTRKKTSIDKIVIKNKKEHASDGKQ